MYVARPSLWASLLMRFPLLTRILDGWGFVYRIRATMALDLRQPLPAPRLPPAYHVIPWDESRLAEVARVDHAAYAGTIDARLYGAYFRSPRGCERMWREAIEGRFGRFEPEFTLLLMQGEQVCGDIMIARRGSTEAFIANLAVAPRHRGGTGKALLLSALEKLQQAGVRRISLAVTPDNERAFGLYQRLGFRVTSYFPMARFDLRRRG